MGEVYTKHVGCTRQNAVPMLCVQRTCDHQNTVVCTEDVTARFDAVFWGGDLNFRILKERDRVDEAVRGIEAHDVPDYDDITRHDELMKVRSEGEFSYVICNELVKVRSEGEF